MAHTLTLALGFLTIVQALPSWKNAEVKRGATDVAKEYDYIVVGAGTAGTTVADRLSEDGKRKQLPDFPSRRLFMARNCTRGRIWSSCPR